MLDQPWQSACTAPYQRRAPSDNKKRAPASLAYSNLKISDLWIKHSTLVIGSYFNSKHYGGRGNRVGAWVGAEVPIKSYFHVLAESVIGYNSLCYTSMGVIVYPYKWMPLTFGVQIPNSKNNSYSFVFELTIIPFK